MRYINRKYWFLVCVFLFIGCSSISVLKKTEPRANVEYMPNKARDSKRPETKDTIAKSDLVISYMGHDSNMVNLMPAVWDSVNKESIGMIHLETVTITARLMKQVAERNGKINIDFMVAVPKEMQHTSWQVNVHPLLSRNHMDVDSLEAIQLTGAKFRKLQYRDYAAYEDYLGRIIPDSADFFNSFVNTKGFYNYLYRMDKHRKKLNDRLSQPGRNVDNTLMERFILFNAIGVEMDSTRRRRLASQQQLIHSRKQTAADIAARYTQPQIKVNSPLLAMRFSYFNAQLEVMKHRYTASRTEDQASDFPVRYFKRDIPPSTWVRQPSGYDRFRLRVTSDFQNPLLQTSRHNLGMGGFRATLFQRDTVALQQRSQAYNYRRRLLIESQLRDIEAQDSLDVVKHFVKKRKITLNEKMKAEKDLMRDKMIPFPLRDGLRLDSVITTRDTLYYKYSQLVDADENTTKLYVYLNGNLSKRSGIFYTIPASDTLTFNVSSMTNFVDETPYYVQRVVSRDAEANSSFLVAFPRNKSVLNENFENNNKELQKVKDMIAKLMKDPIYIIDSISICAYSSPEGAYAINKRFAHERSQAFGQFMNRELKAWSDSLNIQSAIILDEAGNTHLTSEVQQQHPDLSKSMRISSVAENWSRLYQLIENDENIKNRNAITDKIRTVENQDTREYAIRRAFPADYAYIRDKHYSKLRVVDVKFNLHRRGMLKDTIHTTELDSTYMEGVRLLKARKYAQAIEILRPYENVNTALAYMSLGYDDAALRIFSEISPTAEIVYTMAILYARKKDPSKAVEHLMRAVELNSRLKFRANLDPELSELVKKYNLFAEDDF